MKFAVFSPPVHLGLGWLVLTSAACLPDSGPAVPERATPALESSAKPCPVECDEAASATLRDATGAVVGRIGFYPHDEDTWIDVNAWLPEGESGIRGMHVHANDEPDNGEGCVADPEQPASTHFVSADGHYAPEHSDHGHHAGDMPALFFTAAGEASLRFLTDRFHVHELVGRAVILHTGADNYGNVPTGDAPHHYTPNDPAAVDLTARTGNAGARYACGVIEWRSSGRARR